MIRQTVHCVRAFLNLFQEAPPIPVNLMVPGALALAAWPALAVLLGPDQISAAFVTAFVIGLAARGALRADGIILRLRAAMGAVSTSATVMGLGLLPLMLVVWLNDPSWCQRVPSLYAILIGSLFLSDVIGRRQEMAELFWPWPEMRPHLAGLTRAMVLFHMSFLLLNETVIRVGSLSGWLVYWAVLPVISHLVMSALILTVVNIDRDDAAGE